MTPSPKIVLLVGGVGGAKLAHGLYRIMPAENLTIIVNTGDDFWLYGLRICPDLDTIMYTLAELVNKAQGWGLADDTTAALAAMERYGERPWFRLGDQDLATHLLRSERWRSGESLTEITKYLTSRLQIRCTILPMTDDEVATMIDTLEYGELEFQTYFVKHRWQPTFNGLRLAGIEGARITNAVRNAILEADALIIGPSNPWLSINPILSLPGMQTLLAERPIPRLAVTPLVAGQAVKGPTAKLMKELGLPLEAQTIIEYYGDIVNGFIYDERDPRPPNGDLRLVAMDTLMDTENKRQILAGNILSWLREWEMIL